MLVSSTKKSKKNKPRKVQPVAEATVKSPPLSEPSTAKNKRVYKKNMQLIPGSKLVNAGLFLLFVAGTAILYIPDLHLGFFRVDDQQYVVNNPWIKEINSKNIGFILGNPYFVNYSPLHLFSYMIDYAIGGSNAYAFHLSSNIWAGIVAGFVYLTALALTGRRIIAVAAALLFVVHPVHVEAVAWISSRKDLVAAAFILPCLLAYLQYRRTTKTKTGWYILSLVLFLFAIAGKLSVAVFPAVFFAIDVFIEKRTFVKAAIDKIPFLLIAVVFAMAVAAAQPKTGVHPDAAVPAMAFAQSMWLLTGFGKYVIYRVPPQPTEMAGEILAGLIIACLLVAPFFLRKRFPLAVVLIYWILVTFLPTQVLSFTYPVSDRYMFLPSVAACILLAWMIITAGDKFGRKGLIGSSILILLLTAFWTKKTLDYLNEWRDPRSVWWGAKKKSQDTQVYYNLGWNYLDKAARFGEIKRKTPLPVEEAKQFASVEWKDDPRLPALLSELNEGKYNGPTAKLFQQHLQTQALKELEQAITRKGKHIMADLFFHRGLLYLDRGDFPAAKKEFLAGIDEASRLGYAEGQTEVLINIHYNLGVVEWTMGNYKQALHWLKIAEQEQNSYNRILISDLSANRKRLEDFISSTKQ